MSHDHDHDHDHDHGHGHTPVIGAKDELVECPVLSGSMVVKAEAEAAGLVRDHNGKRYWLCCNSCATKWDADPARYAVA